MTKVATKVEPISVDWLSKSSHLNQVYSSGLEYCFITEDNKQVCPFVLCKDFLQDAIMSQYHEKNISIYGFSFDGGKSRSICLNETRMAIGNSSDKNFADKIPNILDLLHQIEKKLHLVRTVSIPISNSPKKYKSGTFLLKGSRRWEVAPPMLSLYTLLIRVGGVHVVGEKYSETFKKLKNGDVQPYQTSDASFIQSAEKGIDRILTYGYNRLFYLLDPKRNYPNTEVHSMHDGFGIVAYSGIGNIGQPKYWHRTNPVKKKKKEENVSTEKGNS